MQLIYTAKICLEHCMKHTEREFNPIQCFSFIRIIIRWQKNIDHEHRNNYYSCVKRAISKNVNTLLLENHTYYLENKIINFSVAR